MIRNPSIRAQTPTRSELKQSRLMMGRVLGQQVLCRVWHCFQSDRRIEGVAASSLLKELERESKIPLAVPSANIEKTCCSFGSRSIVFEPEP
jgi:hypothetical protein